MISLQINAEENDPNLNFKPKVNTLSKKLAEEKIKKEFGDEFGMDVTERLLRDV